MVLFLLQCNKNGNNRTECKTLRATTSCSLPVCGVTALLFLFWFTRNATLHIRVQCAVCCVCSSLFLVVCAKWIEFLKYTRQEWGDFFFRLPIQHSSAQLNSPNGFFSFVFACETHKFTQFVHISAKHIFWMHSAQWCSAFRVQRFRIQSR